MRRAALMLAVWLPLAATSAQPPTREASLQPSGFADELSAILKELPLRSLYAASDRGLEWLAERQSENGGWVADVGHKQMDDYMLLRTVAELRARGEAHMGVSSICGLAFLAGGHLPGRGKFGDTTAKVLRFVLDHVDDTGLITDAGTRMYSHAFATLFLAQAHGMVRDPAIKQALEKAVHLIVDSQNRYGAWRYNAFTSAADLSVTVCQVQSLRAARNIGIQVPKATIDRALTYVLNSRTRGNRRDAGLFYYKIYGRAAYTKNTEFAINAAAVTALASGGVYDRKLWEPALQFVLARYPEMADYYRDHYYFWYGNYYACQAFYWAGGPRFDTYYRRVSNDLLVSQAADGRWRNRVGPGDAFATAVACLILQLPRQYLPIFQR